MATHAPTPETLETFLADAPAEPFALRLLAQTASDVERIVAALRGHRAALARRCVGVAVVSADPALRAAVLQWPGRVTCPLTALPDAAQADGWLAGQRAVGPAGVRPRGGSRTVGLSPALQDWIEAAHNPGPDAIAAEINRKSRARFGESARMCIGEDQGRFLKLLVELLDAEHVVEVGTFTGTSALWMARGLGPKGRLTCFEISDAPLGIARDAWRAAGVAERITVELGPAADGLKRLPAGPCVDLAFVDADKEGYATYFDLLLPRLRPGGIIAFDNMLWGGSVVDPRIDDADTEALRAFTRRLAGEDGLEVQLVSVGDGVTLVRRRGERRAK